MGDPNHVSRRQLLGLGAGAASLGVAGCVFESPSVGNGSVFEDVRVDEQDLVVDLVDGHDVSKLNLIGPNGTAFLSDQVAEGETTIQLPILELDPLRTDYNHYEPGNHEIVAVTGNKSISKSINLEPKVSIRDIGQGTQEDTALGKLEIVLKNTGSGPTWVYDITYRNAPNRFANSKLSGNPGIPKLEYPDSVNEMVLSPGQSASFVSISTPIKYTSQEDQQCSETIEVGVLVGTAAGNVLTSEVVVEVSGEVSSAGLTGQYTCTDVSVDYRGQDSANRIHKGAE